MPRPESAPASTARTLILVYTVELLAVCLLKLQAYYNFDEFAFGDWGTFLTVDYLVRDGATPHLDFGWQYGLLPLLLQRIWFAVAGASPASLLAFSLTCMLPMVALLAAFATIQSGSAGRLLAFLSIPFIINLTDPPHSLEPLLLTAGLYCQAKNDLRSALAFATCAVFVKPSMGYLYGLLLTIFALADLQGRRALSLRELARVFLPAATVAGVLSLLFAVLFGPPLLVSTLIPLSSMHFYRALNFGWPSIVKLFYFPGVKPGYYFGGVGFWATITIFVVAAITYLARQHIIGRRDLPGNYHLVLACGLLQSVFIAVFYGASASWLYYAYIPVMGAMAIEAWGPRFRAWLWLFCLLALLADVALVKSSVRAWRTMVRSPATAGLFAPPDEAAEWSEVTSLVRNDRPVLLGGLGGAGVLFPWSSRPIGTFLLPGVASPIQVERQLEAIRSAKAVVMLSGPPLTDWLGPQTREALGGANQEFKGKYFLVYQRRNSR